MREARVAKLWDETSCPAERGTGLTSHTYDAAAEALQQAEDLLASLRSQLEKALSSPALAPDRGIIAPRVNGFTLTPRQHRIMTLAADGLTNLEIGHALHLSGETVRTHLTRIRRGTGARNKTQLLAMLLGYERRTIDEGAAGDA